MVYANALHLRRTRDFTVCDKLNCYIMNDRKYLVKNKIQLRKTMHKYKNFKRIMPNVTVNVKSLRMSIFHA